MQGLTDPVMRRLLSATSSTEGFKMGVTFEEG